MKEFHTYTLPNGIRGIHRQVKSGVAHCALVVNAGCRDELRDEYGLAHFTEHAIFKGTAHRKAYQVNCRLENLGGELNAYTTKEDTTIHATTLRGDFAKAAELIADVAFNSTFPERELAKEREVIVDEINTYKDSPADSIYDTFEEMIFQGSELGHNILGTKASIARYDRPDGLLVDRQHVGQERAEHRREVLCGISLRLAHVPTHRARSVARVRKDGGQTYPSGALRHGRPRLRRLPLALLVNILGGPSANSRLNVSLREKNGLSYNIEASYTPYNDCGLAAIYFSSDHSNADHCRELIDRELDALRRTKLTPRQLSMAKRQFLAQMAISMESNEGYMLGAGKSFLVHDDIDTMEDVYKKVATVTADRIAEAAEEVFSDMSTLIYK